jgi:hypothetical protein
MAKVASRILRKFTLDRFEIPNPIILSEILSLHQPILFIFYAGGEMERAIQEFIYFITLRKVGDFFNNVGNTLY